MLRLLSLVAALLLGLAAVAPAQDEATDAARPIAEVEKLAVARSEAEDDRVNFTVHLLQARLAQGRGEKATALGHLQRAWRYAPQQTPLLREIVSLAFALEHGGEALRYAALAAEAEGTDPILLRRLALLAVTRRDWRRAIAFFEAGERIDARARRPGEKLDLAALTVKAELGRLYFLADDYVKSAKAFAVVRAALDDPQAGLSDEAKQSLLGKPAETYGVWAEAFLAAGQADDAEALFRRADAALPNPATLAFQLARVAALRGNLADARRELEEYFSSKSTAAGTEPYALFADVIARQQPDAAQARKTLLDRFEKRAALDPDNLPLKLSLAEQYFAANQLDKAEPLLVAVLKAAPSTSAACEPLAEIYYRQNKLDKLLAVAAGAASRTASLDLLGKTGPKIAGNRGLVQRVIESVRLRRRTRPDQLAEGELFAAGLLALEAKEFIAADELLAAAALAQPEKATTILMRWGLGMLLADQNPRAAVAFQKLIDAQPKKESELAQAYYYLAGAKEMAGHTDEALAAAAKAGELAPENPRLESRTAWILYHAKRIEPAIAAYRELVARWDKGPATDERREAGREARQVLSNLEVQRGDFAAATEWLEQALDEFPDDAGANNDLGYLWADRGVHLERARRQIELAVQAEPKNVAYRDSLGWVLLRQGKAAEAVAELEQAAADPAADGVIFEHLGDALAKLGRTAQARAAWLRAETVFQKEPAADKLNRVRAKLEAKP